MWEFRFRPMEPIDRDVKEHLAIGAAAACHVFESCDDEFRHDTECHDATALFSKTKVYECLILVKKVLTGEKSTGFERMRAVRSCLIKCHT